MPNPLPKPVRSCFGGRAAFSLVELLVASSVFTMLLVVAVSTLANVLAVWRHSSERVEAFQSARLGFEMMSRHLAQATLNTYLDYDDAGNPSRYLRKSDLHFVCGPAGENGMPGTSHTGTAVFFQVMLGHTVSPSSFGVLQNGLNTCGYYVEFGPVSKPAILSNVDEVYRYRLMQLLVPMESNTIFANANEADFAWFARFIGRAGSDRSFARMAAENVIAMIVRPQDPQEPRLFASEYVYNSRAGALIRPQPITANQLPPAMEVTLIAIDHTSAKRIENGAQEPSIVRLALSGMFTDVSRFERDMESVQHSLASASIPYRVFRSVFPVLESKWTKN